MYHLSSFPPLVGPVTLLVGVEDDPDGGIRAYLGARYKRIYVHVTDPEAVEQFRRAWGYPMGHTWLWPIPPPEALTKEEEPCP